MASTLRVASARHLAYAPQYVALAEGFFDAEGLAVELLPQPVGQTSIVAMIASGGADLVVGSVLFALRMKDEGLAPILIAQSNQQTRHVLMVRPESPRPDFVWENLRGRSVVIYPNPVPTPWAAFREVLARKNIPLDGIKLIIGYQPDAAVSEFQRGVGDFLLVDQDSAQGTGLVEAASVADALGPVPWSLYCADSRRHSRDPQSFTAFRRALGLGIERLYQGNDLRLAGVLAEFFPETGPEHIGSLIKRYRDARIWTPGAAVMDEPMRRWSAALVRAGLASSERSILEIPVDR